MAELVSIYRVDVNECKELIAEKYHIDPKSIKFWNGKFEFSMESEKESETSH